MILLSPFVPPSASLILYVLLNSKELFLPVCFINLAFSAFFKKKSIDCLNFRVLYTGYVLILTMQVHYLLEECLFTLNKIGPLFLQFSVCSYLCDLFELLIFHQCICKEVCKHKLKYI